MDKKKILTIVGTVSISIAAVCVILKLFNVIDKLYGISTLFIGIANLSLAISNWKEQGKVAKLYLCSSILFILSGVITLISDMML